MCVFGRPIRAFIPLHPGKYQPHSTWRETLKSCEEALRNRHVRAAERLSEHTCQLPPLTVGECVRIQNQTGPHPTKWDKTGIVVEVRQFDQYVVRVDGSGRVTLRNRQFLRKYLPVVPRAPLLMAPGPVTPSAVPRAANPHPQPTAPVQASHQIPQESTATPTPMLPAIPPPTNTRHPPALVGMEPTLVLPASPTTSTTRQPRSPSHQGLVPRALRALLPHNAPGLTAQLAPTVAPPLQHFSPTAPRRSARQSRPPARFRDEP